MKKFYFLVAAALGLGLTAGAQERLYFNGFEDGGAQFTDSIPLDTIFGVDFYSVGEGSNGQHDNATVASWTVEYHSNDTLVLFNAIAPLSSRGDSWEVVADADGSNKAEIEKLGGEGGDYFFKYVAGSEATANCNNYEANLFVRNIPVEDHNSYRVSYYIKTVDGAQVDVELMRGWYNSEKPFSMAGTANSGEHVSVISEFPDNIWTRVTYMTYYTTDSIADLYMHAAGYWWSSSWLATDSVTGKTYNQIKQPDTYFLRFSFMTPSKTYLVDDIAVYNSWIGGAEYNGNIIRINFGYQTNLADLVNANGQAIILGQEAFRVTGIDAAYSEEPIEIDVEAAEYHNDGYMYIFLLDDCSYYEDIRIDFFNPTDEAMQLKYTGSLYPMADDAEWVEAGKIVPDFKNEFVLYNPAVSATPWAEVAPTLLTTDPDDGSFNLDATQHRSFKAYFDKDIYAVEGACESNPEGVLAKIVGGGVDEYLITSEYDAENYAVTFTFPESVPTNLDGDYELLILNARAQETSEPGKEVSVTVSYGKADATAPQWYIQTDFASLGEKKIPAGFTVYGGGFGDGSTAAGTATDAADSSNSRTMLFKETDQIYGCFYLCPRGGNEAILTYGEVEGAALHLTPGDYILSFYYTGWETSMVAFTTSMYKLGDSENTIMKVKKTPTAAHYRGSDATNYTPVNDADYFKQIITVTEEADYVIAWDNSGNGWGGVAIGDIKFSNKYSSAYQSIASFNEAYEACVNKQTEVNANLANYGGDDATTFDALIAKYTGWSHTSPKVYAEVVAELKAGLAAMQTRIDQVDKFYADLAAAYALDSTYAEEDENALVAYTALVQVYEQYKELSCPTKSAEELAEIITAIENATAALNNRLAAMESFEDNLGNCEDIFENYGQFKDLAEFKAVQEAYDANYELDLITCSDEDLTAANNAISTAVSAFNTLMSNVSTLTKQLKDLSALAATVEATFGESTLEDIDAILAVTLVDNQDLAAIYKAGIQAAMSGKLADGADLSATDMTSFIQNPNFYTFATDLKIANNAETFPGWELIASGGNAYCRTSGDGSVDGSLKNMGIGLDWNSSVTLKQTLTYLPAGQYTFGFSTSAWGTLSSSSCAGGFYFAQYDSEGAAVQADTLSTWYSDKSIAFNALGGDVELTVATSTSTTWAFIDDFTLSFDAATPGFDYGAAKTAAEGKLADLISGVKTAKAVSTIEYYNLNGMMLAAPQKGINIRVINGADGSRTVEKVFVR